uniref:F-box domain-containing protein n=1 Tax=Zea mays TaxID=4577 RepID=A0A804R7I9_MAIZE
MQAAAKSYSTPDTTDPLTAMANVSQAVAMPSSSRRHGGRHRAEPPSHSPAPSEPRDWTALPQDILITVFLKLGPREIMLGAEFVCTTWRRVAVGEALLWRRIDMISAFYPARRSMARVALDRSAGQCEAFWEFCDSEMLLYLVKRKLRIRFRTGGYYCGDDWMMNEIIGTFTRMSELRSLALLDCDLTAEGLTAILDHSPVLEDLYITGYFDGIMDAELCAKCAKVKKLTLPDISDSDEEESDEEEYYWGVYYENSSDYEF